MVSYQFDQDHLWHPFTQQKTSPRPLFITSARGPYLYDADKKVYLDLVSSWWTNVHGHGHPNIAQAVYKQAQTLDHVLFAGCTHPPAIDLVRRLSQKLPSSLSRFFFSDNGSTAIEAALKMAIQVAQHQGEAKRRVFLCFDGGYHGDTFGAMSVGKNSGYHDPFRSFFFETHSFPFPETWLGDSEVDEKEGQILDLIREFLNQRSSEIAGFILEPLIQGAAGMRFCRPMFLNALVTLVQSFGIFVIFDEVMTGFGRTGTMFSLDQLSVCPDILCLSKGLTGGMLPLALTITRESIYQSFYDDDPRKAFLHGHSYTAHPLGCAAACASLDLFTKDTFQKIESIASIHQEGVRMLAEIPGISKPRFRGGIGAVTLPDTLARTQIVPKALDQGLLIRPLGPNLYLMPTYDVEEGDLQKAYKKIRNLLAKMI